GKRRSRPGATATIASEQRPRTGAAAAAHQEPPPPRARNRPRDRARRHHRSVLHGAEPPGSPAARPASPAPRSPPHPTAAPYLSAATRRNRTPARSPTYMLRRQWKRRRL